MRNASLLQRAALCGNLEASGRAHVLAVASDSSKSRGDFFFIVYSGQVKFKARQAVFGPKKAIARKMQGFCNVLGRVDAKHAASFH
jgi:hypothetical protein